MLGLFEQALSRGGGGGAYIVIMNAAVFALSDLLCKLNEICNVKPR